ncbi:MAG: hypothetical protein H6757_04445 [Candidatus Omnitrophica bacterium]|nr:hypothetical protein [Candidatus Omnitrophota bacterium]
MKKILYRISVFLILLLCYAPYRMYAQSHYERLYSGFEVIEESQAYQQFLLHEKSELSKLIYLIDRFEHADVVIIYDGFRIPAQKAAPFARWFLSHNYRNQTAKEWVLQWCSRTVPRNRLIKVSLPDGNVKLARDILMDELKWLDELTCTRLPYE